MTNEDENSPGESPELVSENSGPSPEVEAAAPDVESASYHGPSLARLSVLWLGCNLFWSIMLSQVLQQRVEHFGGDHKGSYIAIIGALGALVSTLVQLVIGPISDNYSHPKGRRYPFVVWGIGLGIAPIISFAISGSFVQLLFSFVLIQLLLNIAIGPFQAVIPDRVHPHHHGRASGWMGLWQLLGQILGLALPGLLLSPSAVNGLTGQSLPDGEAKSLGVILALGVAVFFLVVCLLLNAPLLVQPALPRSSTLSMKEALRDAFDLDLKSHPDFAWLLVSRFIINIGISSVIEFLRYYVDEVFHPKDLALQTMYIGLAATAGGVIGTLVAGRMSDRISKRKVVYFSCAFASIAGIGFCLTHSIAVAIILGFVFGIGYGAFCAVDWAFAANLMPKNKEGKYMAIFHIAFTVPQALSFLFGIIGQHWGFRMIYAMVPVYLLLGAIVISKVRERHEIPEEARTA